MISHDKACSVEVHERINITRENSLKALPTTHTRHRTCTAEATRYQLCVNRTGDAGHVDRGCWAAAAGPDEDEADTDAQKSRSGREGGGLSVVGKTYIDIDLLCGPFSPVAPSIS